jgi:hypothetical protein
MLPEAYLSLAYELALWTEIRSRLMSIVLNAKDGRTDVIARQAPFAARFVTERVAADVLHEVLAKEHALIAALGEWEWVRRPIDAAPKRQTQRER